ncbi:MAG: fumarylacetoacetate hydrolase family protein [Sedimentisphaerales bacterium]|nr:fumarylacetoacetate hydrolase family protein [Sedimentisphaerales bacterium]
MKIIRFLTTQNEPLAGVLQDDGTIERLRGDLFGQLETTGQILRPEQIQYLLPPVIPPNIFALGLNYREHARETDAAIPKAPLIFIKATTSLTAHRCPILLPQAAPDEVDYEAELVIVIKKTARRVSLNEAPNYILGYTCGNDVTARDCQKRIDRQWARSKSFDTFAPTGPVLETELDPGNLRIRSFRNGQLMQDSTTADLIFSVPQIVSTLSHNFTLLPGTLIFTGTPPGVGAARRPPVFLRSGDTIAVEIEGIGRLENTVRTDQPTATD